MSLFSSLLAVFAIFVFVACILFVLFGQVTVRKLRKNPKTKDVLGGELLSGWDILNVAQALAFPASWLKRIENSPLSFMEADSRIVRENTNKFDHILGMIFYWLFMGTGLFGLVLVLLQSMGVFGD